jgi:phage terminase small subunit
MARTKLTPKQKVFVEEYVKTKNGTKAALKAYDTTDEVTAAAISYENLRKPQIRTITEQLFSLEKTIQVVDNLHKLAISAEDEKVQVESTKVWLDRAVPKTESPTAVQFNQIQITHKDKYDL